MTDMHPPCFLSFRPWSCGISLPCTYVVDDEPQLLNTTACVVMAFLSIVRGGKGMHTGSKFKHARTIQAVRVRREKYTRSRGSKGRARDISPSSWSQLRVFRETVETVPSIVGIFSVILYLHIVHAINRVYYVLRFDQNLRRKANHVKTTS